jgi:hypothetical protein
VGEVREWERWACLLWGLNVGRGAARGEEEGSAQDGEGFVVARGVCEAAHGPPTHRCSRVASFSPSDTFAPTHRVTPLLIPNPSLFRFPCLCAPEVPGWVFWPPNNPPSDPLQGDIDVAGFLLLLGKASRGFPQVEDCQWTPPARPFMEPSWLP